MRHEPRRFVGNAERAVKLVSRNALLVPGHEPKAAKPLVQGDFAILKDRADRCRERLAAGVAHHDTGTGALALQPLRHSVSPHLGQTGSLGHMRAIICWRALSLSLQTGAIRSNTILSRSC